MCDRAWTVCATNAWIDFDQICKFCTQVLGLEILIEFVYG